MNYCSSCGRELDFGSESCAYCADAFSWGSGSASDSRSSTNSQSNTFVNSGQRPSAFTGSIASRGIRLGAWLLDIVLFAFLLGLGWLIWFAFTARHGQTPAKRILKLRVTDSVGASYASVTIWRYVVPNVFSWVSWPFTILGIFSLPYSLALLVSLVQWASWVVPLADALFIFSPDQKRLVDHLFKTKVVHL
jgi:uncharacterized RDD family membrane protein YckC